MANKYLDDNGLLYFWQKIKNAINAASSYDIQKSNDSAGRPTIELTLNGIVDSTINDLYIGDRGISLVGNALGHEHNITAGSVLTANLNPSNINETHIPLEVNTILIRYSPLLTVNSTLLVELSLTLNPNVKLVEGATKLFLVMKEQLDIALL